MPPRRLDFIFCLFFLWVWANQVVRRSNSRTLDKLERKIRDTLPVFVVTFRENYYVCEFQIAKMCEHNAGACVQVWHLMVVWTLKFCNIVTTRVWCIFKGTKLHSFVCGVHNHAIGHKQKDLASS